MEDGGKGDGAVESLPKTQGISLNTAIVIPDDKDEDEEEEGQEEEEEEEDDCQLDDVPPPFLEINPVENHASYILEGGPSVSSAGIPGKSSATILP